MTEAFRQDSHYVACLYLKRWASHDGYLWRYRILVSRREVPDWGRVHIQQTAKHKHLYTQSIDGSNSDEVEKWLEKEFETPAEGALQKATSDVRLTRDDWLRLVHFLSAQIVRTPRQFNESLRCYEKLDLEQVLSNAIISRATDPELESPPSLETQNVYNSPVRVRKQIGPEGKVGLKAEVLVGRGLWLRQMPALVKRVALALENCEWTILTAPEGTSFPTSDDPVVRLSFHSPSAYSFNAGLSSQGTELLLPLDPRHLMYTKVGGGRPLRRGTRLSHVQAKWVRRLVAGNAHRFIFAPEADAEVTTLRPRKVDADLYEEERRQWDIMHEDQVRAEQGLMGE